MNTRQLPPRKRAKTPPQGFIEANRTSLLDIPRKQRRRARRIRSFAAIALVAAAGISSLFIGRPADIDSQIQSYIAEMSDSDLQDAVTLASIDPYYENFDF